MSNNHLQHFDIVIAGGGLSGALSALSLAQLSHNGWPLSIAIIEANAIYDDPTLTFDSRVLALSHGSVSYLTELGVWQALEQDAASIDNIHISDRGYYGKARINANDHQVSALGHVIEMSLLGKALLNRLAQNDNITWFCPDSIQAIEWQQEQVNLTLDSKLQLETQLLLACDGAQSTCRQFAHIAATSKPYQQSALIVNLRMAKPHQNKAFERFTETGPIAVLPLNDGTANSQKCSLVWTLTPQKADEMMALDDEAFKQALIRAFGLWLGAVEQVGQRAVYPLHLVQAQEQVYHRMILVGNASHTIHPIAGQGFNLGLRDVMQLSAMLKTSLEQNKDIALFSSLTDYAKRRAEDHQAIITLTDSLVTLFSNQLPPLVAGRNIGLKALNYLTPLKQAFVNKTMGY